MTERVHPFPGNRLLVVRDFGAYGEAAQDNHLTNNLDRANAVTSLVNADYPEGREFHRPVLDIDMPVRVLESSTPGHHHLFIDKPMSRFNYFLLLHVMADVGLLERGYVNASIERGYSAVRLPWIKQGEA